MSSQRSFTNAPDAPAHARRFVASALADVPRDIADEIAIMVSELATNCVRHTVTDFTVAVEQSPQAGARRCDRHGWGNARSPLAGPQRAVGPRPAHRAGALGLRSESPSGGTRRAKPSGSSFGSQDHLANRSTRAMAGGTEEKSRRPDPGTGARPWATRADGPRSRPEASCRGRAVQGGLPASRSRTLA